MGTPSVYSIHASHMTLRSSNLRSTRSMKSLRVPWYQRPILKDAYFLDTQRGALVIAFYSLVTRPIVVGPVCTRPVNRLRAFCVCSFWAFSRWPRPRSTPTAWPWPVPAPLTTDTTSWATSLCTSAVLGVSKESACRRFTCHKRLKFGGRSRGRLAMVLDVQWENFPPTDNSFSFFSNIKPIDRLRRYVIFQIANKRS